MTKLEQLIINKATELTYFHSRIDALPLKVQKENANNILDTHRIIRLELKSLIDRYKEETK